MKNVLPIRTSHSVMINILVMVTVFILGCSNDHPDKAGADEHDMVINDGSIESETDGSGQMETDSADGGREAGIENETPLDHGIADATIDHSISSEAGSSMEPVDQGMMPDEMPRSNESEGCGVHRELTSGAYEIEVDGSMRTYHIVLPDGYDPETSYKLIFVWHGLGGSAEREVSSHFKGLGNQNDGSAIFVAGQGLPQVNPLDPDGPQRNGWANRNDSDIHFARDLLTQVKSDYCIDLDRIFSTGWSYGGIMTNRVGCYFAEEVRAIAPVMGQGPEVWQQSGDCSMRIREANCSTGQVAVWMTHGSADTIVPYCGGERSRDYWQVANGCSMDTVEVDQNGCIAYSGCDDDYPVIWCPTDLGHTIPSFAPQKIWEFFSRF